MLDRPLHTIRGRFCQERSRPLRRLYLWSFNRPQDC